MPQATYAWLAESSGTEGCWESGMGATEPPARQLDHALVGGLDEVVGGPDFLEVCSTDGCAATPDAVLECVPLIAAGERAAAV